MNPNYAPAATERKPERIEIPVQKKDEKQAPASKAEAAKAPEIKRTEETAPTAVDTVLEGKLALMEAGKADKVRAALAARGRSM